MNLVSVLLVYMLRNAFGYPLIQTGLLAGSNVEKEPKNVRRCGTVQKNLSSAREKRFVPHENRWSHTVLSWKLLDPYQKLTLYDQFTMRNVLHRAFYVWTKASARVLTFYEVTNSSQPTDISVYFAEGDHNDTLPFDGRDGVVAHGFYPTNGNLHFDAAEQWTLESPYGINLFQTAVHEIGHLIGLEHSQDWRAAMYPVNRPYDAKFRLTNDDIQGVLYLYAPWLFSYLHGTEGERNGTDDSSSTFNPEES